MTPETDVTVTIVLNEKGNPPEMLAEAERHVRTGRLDGLKRIGGADWELRGATGFHETFPTAQVPRQRRAASLRAVAAAG